MKLRKLSTGNYMGYHAGYYFFVYRRPHGKWCCRIGRGGEWLYREGYHGISLPTLLKGKIFVRKSVAE